MSFDKYEKLNLGVAEVSEALGDPQFPASNTDV
jgi:hypothetical protein